MTNIAEQHRQLQNDLEQRRAELMRLDLTPLQLTALPRLEADHIDKMRKRLAGEINELERYIVSMGVPFQPREDNERLADGRHGLVVPKLPD